MVAGSGSCIFNRIGIGPTILLTGLMFVTSPHAQIQRDIDRCAGKDVASPELQIQSCTALIESKAYAGRELTFAFNSRGLAYYDKRDFDSAVASFNQAIALDPKFAPGYNREPQAWQSRALAAYAKQDYGRAIADFTEAIRLNPNNGSAIIRVLSESRMRLGNAYYAENDYDRAIDDYSDAIRLGPRNIRAYSNRGGAYYAKHDYRRAIADFSEVIRLDPNDASAYTARGNAYNATGEIDRADADFNDAKLRAAQPRRR